MIISILTRKTRLTDRARWEVALAAVLPQIREIVASEAGFVSLQYLWNADEPGEVAQTTTWRTLDDCRRYVRRGGAAKVAMIEDAAIPTAAHPDGAWVRRTYEAASPHPDPAPANPDPTPAHPEPVDG